MSLRNLQPGTLVEGRYELGKKLGQGGFGTVYQALDKRIGREVAVKVLDLLSLGLDADMAQQLLTRFEREAHLTAKIRHPGIVQIHDFGLIDADAFSPYMVMELLEGVDLESWIKERGPLDPARLIPLFATALEALGEAHKVGIVHKDLKPSNLFLQRPGERLEAIRVVDFGIAHESAHGRMTGTGRYLGTLQYFAPEYLGGQIITPALDVYQMGLILAELLTGDTVLEVTNPVALAQRYSLGRIELPAYLLESPLGPVLRRALEMDYTKRYADGEVFAAALRQVNLSLVPPRPSGTLVFKTFMDPEQSMRLAQRYMSLDHIPEPEEAAAPGSHAAPSTDAPSVPALSEERGPVEQRRAASPAQPTVIEHTQSSPSRLGPIVALLSVCIIIALAVIATLANRDGQPAANEVSAVSTAPPLHAQSSPSPAVRPSPDQASPQAQDPAPVGATTLATIQTTTRPARLDRPRSGAGAKPAAEAPGAEAAAPTALPTATPAVEPTAPPTNPQDVGVIPAAVPSIEAPDPAEEPAPNVAQPQRAAPPKLQLKAATSGGCVKDDVLNAVSPHRTQLLACMMQFGQGEQPTAQISWVSAPGSVPRFAKQPAKDEKLLICLQEKLGQVKLLNITSSCQAALSLKVLR
jgi:serine/threonine protein kinase